MPAIIAIVLGLVVLVVLLKLAFKIVGFAIAIAFALIVYFVAEKLFGKGRA